MKRRYFSSAAAALAATALSPLAVQAQSPAVAPVKGKDYVPLSKQVPTQSVNGRIEVVEFFWYECPHCNAFEPAFESWIKRAPAQVQVRRVPVAFSEDALPLQRLYFALESMGMVERLHTQVFAAIHTQKIPLKTEEAITAWVSQQGVDKALFSQHYNSFTVQSKARAAVQLQDAYQVEGVPALGVAGRFYTDGTMTKNMDRALQVVDFLVAQIRAGR